MEGKRLDAVICIVDELLNELYETESSRSKKIHPWVIVHHYQSLCGSVLPYSTQHSTHIHILFAFYPGLKIKKGEILRQPSEKEKEFIIELTYSSRKYAKKMSYHRATVLHVD